MRHKIADMTKPELVFLHIPKAAGTSQHRSFRQYYGASNIFWFGEDCSPDIRNYPTQLVGKRLLVGGHKPLSFYPDNFDPLYCAVLRDPVERAISLFGYYTRPELARSEQGRRRREEILSRRRREGLDPDSMLQSIRASWQFRQEVSNAQCAYITKSGANFRSALKSLQSHDFVLGTMDEYLRFHEFLGQTLDWPEETPRALNRSRGGYAEKYLEDGELVDLLREINEQDFKLLDFVRGQHNGLYINLLNTEARQKRLGNLPMKPWLNRRLGMGWRDAAAQLWPARTAGDSSLPWPLATAMVAERSKLLYMPIPGPATPFVKRFMLDCAKLEHADAALDLGLGGVLAAFETGLMLDDHEAAFTKSLRQSDEYCKFSVINEPVTRLVSNYAAAFVTNREELPQRPGLAALVNLIAEVRGSDGAAIERGISFREFVSAIVQRDPKQQHPLWIPQYLYLKGMGEYDKLYREDQVQVIARDMSSFTGVTLEVPSAAPVAGCAPAMAGEGVITSGKYADTLSTELPVDPDEWRSQLVDERLCAQIVSYYAQDCRLYNDTGDSAKEGMLK